MSWQSQQARQHFSEVLRAAKRDGPQIITRHGQEVAVVIDIDEYRRLTAPRRTLTELLLGPADVEDDVATVLAGVAGHPTGGECSPGAAESGRAGRSRG